MRTYNDLTLMTRKKLMQADIPGYQLESRLLVAHAAGKSVAELLRDMNLYTTEDVVDRVSAYVERRLAGEPVAYITGTWEFYGLPMVITPDVLIPRMDTEVLVDAVKEFLTGRKMDARVLDLCCGSGCIACAIAKELPATKLVAVDISASALQVCRENVTMNRLNSRVLCLQADALSSPPMGMGQFDIIVSNPPYIASSEIMVIKYWRSVLKPGGLIFFEVGEGEAEAVRSMLLEGGFAEAEFRQDSGGTDRVVIGRLEE